MAIKKTTDLVQIAVFISLICVGAFFRVPLPSVPFTLQFMMVNLAGMLAMHFRFLYAIYL